MANAVSISADASDRFYNIKPHQSAPKFRENIGENVAASHNVACTVFSPFTAASKQLANISCKLTKQVCRCLFGLCPPQVQSCTGQQQRRSVPVRVPGRGRVPVRGRTVKSSKLSLSYHNRALQRVTCFPVSAAVRLANRGAACCAGDIQKKKKGKKKKGLDVCAGRAQDER